MLMLGFARSELNALIVGGDFASVVASVPHVFLVAMAGYFALLLGGSFWSMHLGVGLRRAAARLLDGGPSCSAMVMSSQSLLIFLSCICLVGQLALVLVYFVHGGFGFNLRAYTFENPGIRPIAQLVALSSTAVIPHSLARYLDTKEKPLLVCSLVLSFGLLFFGQRGSLIFAYMNLVLCYVIGRGRDIGIMRIVAMAVTLLGLIFYLGNVREGLYSPAEFVTSLVFLAFYGNNFCDLRDFAWIDSHWNHQLWLGKTYLAGLATFLPRSISDFRATWSFGVATDWTVGLDTELHPGLKPGEFGELFFNFGLLGVILGGLLIGILVRRADLAAKSALGDSRPSMVRAFSSTMLISVALCIDTSLALPGIYALCGIYAIGWLWLQVVELLQPKDIRKSEAAIG